MKSSSVSEETKDVKKINNRIIGEVKSKPSKLYWSGVDTKDNWIKAFDEKFPYNGCIFEDDGRSYNFDDIKSFISQVEKDAIEKTNKRWRKRLTKRTGGNKIIK